MNGLEAVGGTVSVTLLIGLVGKILHRQSKRIDNVEGKQGEALKTEVHDKSQEEFEKRLDERHTEIKNALAKGDRRFGHVEKEIKEVKNEVSDIKAGVSFIQGEISAWCKANSKKED